MPAPSLTTAAFFAVLRRLQGRGGWTNEEGTNRLGELEATATAASEGSTLIRDAGRAAFPTLDVTGVGTSEWERVLRVVQDYPVTTLAGRAARIVAYRSLRSALESAGMSSLITSFSETGVDAMWTVDAADLADDLTLEAEALLHVGAMLASWPSSGRVVAAARALVRHLPGHHIATDALRHASRALYPNDDQLDWGGGSNLYNHLAAQTPPITAYDVPPARVVSYSAENRLLDEDLNQIQREIFFRGGRGGMTESYPGAFYRVIVTTLNAGLGTDRVIDSSFDWRARFFAVEGRYQNQAGGYSAPASILPGDGAEQNINGGGSSAPLYGSGYTLGGGATSELDCSESSGNVIFYVDAATGSLRVKKSGALTSVNVVAQVWSTGIVQGGGGEDIQRVFSGDHDSGPDTTLRDELLQAHFKIGNTGNVSYPNMRTGGLHRFGFACNMVRPSTSTAVLVRVLDASADWRDRLITVEFALRAGTYGVVPGADDTGIFRDDATTVLRYTGAGAVDGVGNVVAAWQCELIPAAFYIYADSVTGALKLQLKGGSLVAGPRTMALAIRASAQLGVHVTGAAVPTLPTHSSDLITAADWHIIQDSAIPVQFFGGRRSLATEDVPIASEAYPLGRALSGVPRVPRELRYRERIGERPDIEASHLAQRRPFIPGGLRFPFAVSVADSTNVTIDPSDWRDRILVIRYRLTATAILPGEASESAYNALPATRIVAYTGAIFEYEIASDVYLRAEQGGLVISNASGGALKFTGIVEATGMLGPRSRG